VTSLQELRWEGDLAELTRRLAAELEWFLQQASVPTQRPVVPAAALAGHEVRA
jgi:hypothetical protein